MGQASELERATIARYLKEEAHRAVRTGAPYAAVLGLLCSTSIFAVQRLGLARGLEVPMFFSGFGGVYSCALYLAARYGRLTGPIAYAGFLTLVSLPSFFFLLAEALVPSGAATFLNGPFSFLYLVLLVMTGLMFDARLARIAGVVATAGYLLCYALARPKLEQVSAPDPVLRQDLVAPAVYAFRAVMILMGGLMVGATASVSRRLLLRVLHEEREKQGISRLFGQYVSVEVKEKLLREESGDIAELKTVVILFSDINAFTAYSERQQPAALVRHLNEYFDGMVGCIAERGGVVDKFIGDAVMAVFGGIIELPNPAEAALDAALGMRRRLRALNAEWASRGIEVLGNGIGLHLGEVLQGTIGSADRKEFTVIGDAVNTAARLEERTREAGFPILVSGSLVEALPPGRRAACVPLGRMRLKGKAREVEVFGVRDGA